MKKILNVLLGLLMAVTVALLVYALATGGDNAAISLNLIWGYLLFAGALAAAVFCAVFGMIQNPQGIRGTVLSLALIVIIIGAAYFYSNGHTVNILDLSTGGFFDHAATVLTETSILVTYAAFVAAVITAVGTEIYRAFK